MQRVGILCALFGIACTICTVNRIFLGPTVEAWGYGIAAIGLFAAAFLAIRKVLRGLRS
jgi:hypothetical protein